jgi:hypothetical protein
MQSIAGAVDRQTVARALEDVFARPELRPPGESWLERQLERLIDLLPSGGALPEAAAWGLVWLLAIVLGLLLGWLVVQLRRNVAWRRAPEAAREVAGAAAVGRTARDRVADLRRRAREAREQGDLVAALRLTFFALLVGLGRGGGLEYRDTWTARELVERGRPAPEVAATLAPLVRRIDERTFGRRPVTGEDVDELEALCARWLDGGEGAP